MKFEIDAKVFKSVIERVFAAVPSKAVFSQMEEVRIMTKHNSIVVSSFDGECACRISAYAMVSEYGEAYVSKDDLKKIYTIKGDILNIESNGVSITVKSGKKKSTVAANPSYDMDADALDFDHEYMPESKVLVMPASKLNEVLSSIAVFASKNADEPNEVLKAIHFNVEDGEIVGIDGHRIGVFNGQQYFYGNNMKFNIPNVVATHMKKILPKNDSNVYIYCMHRFCKFVGEDFEYVVKVIDGEYFDYHRFMEGYDAGFDVDKKELFEAAKEYKKLMPKDCKKPMFMRYDPECDTLFTGLMLANYRTSDIVNVENTSSIKSLTPNGFVKGFNPEFIYDAVNILRADNYGNVAINITDGAKYNPITISDGEYTALILPVMTDCNEEESFKEYTAA